jgi:penicillin-binding protein 2
VLDYIKSALGGVVKPPGTAKGAFHGFPLGQVAIGGKTGTADVNDKAPTSWFASFAPVNGTKFVTVVMVPEAGTGGTTAAPIARKIWDGIYGLEGSRPLLLPGGKLPATLPVVLPDGSIGRPGTVVPRRAAATVTPTSHAAPVAPALPWAEPPRRRWA